jgi:Uma2 family endonuclease
MTMSSSGRLMFFRPSAFRSAHPLPRPDLTVLRADAPDEQIITHPPLIVIEILSPGDSLLGMREKIEDYLAFAIPNIWVVDPSDRMGYVCRSGRFREWQPASELTVPGTAIALDLAQLPA